MGAEGYSAAATRSEPLTGKGTLLGTVQYMAPEQVEGKDADHRTDIFAFGTLVYEMATGQRAFSGESQASLIAAILDREPVPMSTLQPVTPARLDEIVTTCLRKDPDDRWQSAGDVGRQVQGIRERGSQPSDAVAWVTVPQPASWRRAMPWVAGLALGSIIAAFAVWNVMRSSPDPVARFVISSGATERIFDGSFGTDLALSPDGQRVAYLTLQGAYGELRVRDLDQLRATTLVRGERAHSPFFSPDGEWIGFSVPRRTDVSAGPPQLLKVSVHGGPLIQICEVPGTRGGPASVSWNGASWGTDDTIVFATGQTDSGLWRVDADVGEPELLTTPDTEQGEIAHRWPDILPGGDAALFTIMRSNGMDDADIAVLSLEDREWHVLVRGGSHPRYVPTGHLVYAVRGALHAVPFDLNALDVTGEPIPVLTGVTTKASGAADFGLSQNGSLAYLSSDETGGSARTFVWVDRQGREEPLPFEPDDYAQAALSPDGTRIAVQIGGRENTDVWIGEVARGTLSRLTTDPANDGNPLWTLDGQGVVFESDRDGSLGLFRAAVDGTDPVERLVTIEGATMIDPRSWSPDGKTLAFFYRDSPVTGQDVGVLSMDGERAWEPLIQGEPAEGGPRISPDGRWLMYASGETGLPQVYVQRFPELGQRQQVSTAGGYGSLWSADGREIAYSTLDGRLVVVAIETEPAFQAGNQTRLDLAPEFVSGWYLLSFVSASPDFQRFLLTKPTTQTDDTSVELVLVQNWSQELLRLVPVD